MVYFRCFGKWFGMIYVGSFVSPLKGLGILKGDVFPRLAPRVNDVSLLAELEDALKESFSVAPVARREAGEPA